MAEAGEGLQDDTAFGASAMTRSAPLLPPPPVRPLHTDSTIARVPACRLLGRGDEPVIEFKLPVTMASPRRTQEAPSEEQQRMKVVRARILSSRPVSDQAKDPDNFMTHMLEYIVGGTGQEWARLDEAKKTLRFKRMKQSAPAANQEEQAPTEPQVIKYSIVVSRDEGEPAPGEYGIVDVSMRFKRDPTIKMRPLSTEQFRAPKNVVDWDKKRKALMAQRHRYPDMMSYAVPTTSRVLPVIEFSMPVRAMSPTRAARAPGSPTHRMKLVRARILSSRPIPEKEADPDNFMTHMLEFVGGKAQEWVRLDEATKTLRFRRPDPDKRAAASPAGATSLPELREGVDDESAVPSAPASPAAAPTTPGAAPATPVAAPSAPASPVAAPTTPAAASADLDASPQAADEPVMPLIKYRVVETKISSFGTAPRLPPTRIEEGPEPGAYKLKGWSEGGRKVKFRGRIETDWLSRSQPGLEPAKSGIDPDRGLRLTRAREPQWTWKPKSLAPLPDRSKKTTMDTSLSSTAPPDGGSPKSTMDMEAAADDAAVAESPKKSRHEKPSDPYKLVQKRVLTSSWQMPKGRSRIPDQKPPDPQFVCYSLFA